MEDIYTLLNINTGVLQDFSVQAARVVDHQTELAINRSIRSLKEIEKSMLSDNSIKISLQSIDEVMLKVIENASTNNQDFSIWSTRELRIVSYYLMKLQGNEDAYKYALVLLDKNWRDLFFNGLSFYCLDCWNSIDPPLRMLTCELLRNKLTAYTGENNKYKTMKNHANLFDEAGPLRLSTILVQRKKTLVDSTSYFYSRPSTFSQSYYSDVIVKYFMANNVMDIDYVDSILQQHKSDRTKKLVMADLVERMNNLGNELQRNVLCKYANRILGDITLSSTWAPFAGATETEAMKLKKAKQLVNLWFNQKIIETFFEVCVQDRERKTYWLDYVGHLSGFRIIGSTATRRLLQADERISGIFLPYFIETDSYHSQTSALVLFIKNKMIVEFSDTGALYVYNQDHSMVKQVTRKKASFTNTADLKIPSMTNLVVVNDWGNTNYREEGRMTHQGRWQSRLDRWLAHMVLSSNNASISFFDTDDNELFKAKPVEKEPFKPSTKSKEETMQKEVNPTKDKVQIIEQRTSASKATSKENKTAESKRLPKTNLDAIAKPKELNLTVPTIKKAVYETNITYSIASKWFFGTKCRIIANDRGYYANVNNGRTFVMIKDMLPFMKATGSLWIKGEKTASWAEIVHVSANKEIIVGYIKEAGGGLMYKPQLKFPDFMTIKLR